MPSSLLAHLQAGFCKGCVGLGWSSSVRINSNDYPKNLRSCHWMFLNVTMNTGWFKSLHQERFRAIGWRECGWVRNSQGDVVRRAGPQGGGPWAYTHNFELNDQTVVMLQSEKWERRAHEVLDCRSRNDIFFLLDFFPFFVSDCNLLLSFFTLIIVWIHVSITWVFVYLEILQQHLQMEWMNFQLLPGFCWHCWENM